MRLLKKIGIWILIFALGGISNSLILQLGLIFIPPPAGSDFSTAEGLAKSMATLNPEHFVVPFLAHAGGTFISALLLTWLLRSVNAKPALLAGCVFLAAGTYMVLVLPAPLWFEILDLSLAYIPAAYIGFLCGANLNKKT